MVTMFQFYLNEMIGSTIGIGVSLKKDMVRVPSAAGRDQPCSSETSKVKSVLQTKSGHVSNA
jgi:hypothetical protein